MLWLVLSSVVSMSSAQAPVTPSISGTQWQFPAAKMPEGMIVTFRKDGVTLFTGLKTTGHWKQDGAIVVFDANEFTEYRVTIKGNEMTGSWIRLQGLEKGATHPTSLKKL